MDLEIWLYNQLTNLSFPFFPLSSGREEQRVRGAVPKHEVWPIGDERASGVLPRALEPGGVQLKAADKAGQQGGLERWRYILPSLDHPQVNHRASVGAARPEGAEADGAGQECHQVRGRPAQEA